MSAAEESPSSTALAATSEPVDLDVTQLADSEAAAAAAAAASDPLAATLPAASAPPREAPTSFAATLAAASVTPEQTAAPAPSYRTNARLFDEFKSSRMKAAAGSLQQRFATSIQQLNQLSEYQRSKTGRGAVDEADARAAARHREHEEVTLERAVMRPRSAMQTSQVSTRAQSAHSSVVYNSPPRARSEQSYRAVQLPHAALHHQEEKEQHSSFADQRSPPRSPIYQRVAPQAQSASSVASAPAGALPMEDAPASRLRHIEKAFETVPFASSAAAVNHKSFPSSAPSMYTRPIVPQTSPRAADAPLPISRPISVALSPRASARSSPRASVIASPQARRSSHSKKKDALPSHVTRLMEIQSAHAARAGSTSSEDSEDDDTAAFARRRTRNRVPVIPVPTPSPKMRRFRSADEARVPIQELAASMLREDQKEDPKAFLDLPTPKSLLQSASSLMQSYQSLPKPSYSVPSSSVHIHVHHPLEVAAAVPELPLPVFEAPHLSIHAPPSPVMSAHHPPTWEQHTENLLHMQQMQIDHTRRQVDELYQQNRSHRMNAEAEADAEFDSVQSLLQSDSKNAASGGSSLLHPSIDNYNYPPHLFDRSVDDPIMTTMLKHEAEASQRRASNAHPAEPFQYTQKLYHPTHSHASSARRGPPSNHFDASRDAVTPSPMAAGPSVFHPLPSLHTRFNTSYASSDSLPAHSFFQPNDSYLAASQNELQRYPPVLRQQLQQHMTENGIPIMPYASTTSHLSRSRSRVSSPAASQRMSSHTADTSLMSPSRLAAYLHHYLAHRTQVLPSPGSPGQASLYAEKGEFVPDPAKVALTQSEADQLRTVIVELNSIRSAHDLSPAGQQVITRLRPAPAASAPARSPAVSPERRVLTPAKLRRATLQRSKQSREPSESPPPRTKSRAQSAQADKAPSKGFPLRTHSSSIVSRPDREQRTQHHEVLAEKRQNVRAKKSEERLTDAFLKLAEQKRAHQQHARKHAQRLNTFRKENPKTLETGLGEVYASSEDEEWRNSLKRK